MGCCISQGPNEFDRALLSATNRMRAKHGSPPLKWSREAARKAQDWAQHLANIGSLQHGNHEDMGQNLAYKAGAELTGEEAVDIWYKEIAQYDFSQPGFKSNTGHFTQLVWASTTHMGAAKATKGNQSFVVANYVPPGNVTNAGQFERNVKKAK